jgi:hypothetical protein
MQSYEIIDEPSMGRWAHLTVNPFWILLATMLGGTWLGWPWFVINSLAIGSMHRRREIAAVLIGFAGTALLTAVGLWSIRQDYLDSVTAPYAGLVLVVWKLAVSYLLQGWQAPGYELACYFRGKSRNGALLAFAGLFLRFQLLRGLSDFWALVLS